MGTEWEPYLLDLIPNYFDHDIDSADILDEHGDDYYKLRLRTGNTASFKEAHRLLSWNTPYLKNSEFAGFLFDKIQNAIKAHYRFSDYREIPEILTIAIDDLIMKLNPTLSTHEQGKILYFYPGDVAKALNKEETRIPDLNASDASASHLANITSALCRYATSSHRFLTRFFYLGGQGLLGAFSESELHNIGDRIQLYINNKIGAIGAAPKIARENDLLAVYRRGIGGGSCMTGESRNKRLKLYKYNGGRVSVFYIDSGSISARALLWRLDSGEYFLDRIYSNSEALRDKFYDIARENKYYFVRWNNGRITAPSGYRFGYEDILAGDKKALSHLNNLVVSGLVNTKAIANGGTPYLDSFNIIIPALYERVDLYHTYHLQTRNPKIKGHYKATSTAGKGAPYWVCPHCKSHISLEYAPMPDPLTHKKYNKSGVCYVCNVHRTTARKSLITRQVQAIQKAYHEKTPIKNPAKGLYQDVSRQLTVVEYDYWKAQHYKAINARLKKNEQATPF